MTVKKALLGFVGMLAFVFLSIYAVGYAIWGPTVPDWTAGPAAIYGLLVGFTYSMWAMAKL